ncbi:MAG: DUF1326 domain-containing protein [Bacteroidetes bacterium]|nr:DUF1326 domain-containing protein [Bacteroidota bacterium]
MADIPKWHAKGEWFDVCRCDVPCPCSWAQPPSDDYCEAILVWHIHEGSYGDVPLAGLNVVALASFHGNYWDDTTSEAKMGVLLDDRAHERQREALEMIFGGRAGGWPALYNDIFGAEVVGLDFAPITFEVADDRTSWKAEVPGRIRAAAMALVGPTSDGKPPRMKNLPGSETGPGQIATQGKATADHADVFGFFKWDHEGKSSKHITFDWSGPDG